MLEDLRGKAVLVTGASLGIGAAAALGFGRQGANVAVHYNKNKEAAKTSVPPSGNLGSRPLPSAATSRLPARPGAWWKRPQSNWAASIYC